MPNVEEGEPAFKPGDLVEHRTGFFEGKGEVLKNVHTRHGWFTQVIHRGAGGEMLITPCTPSNLKKEPRC